MDVQLERFGGKTASQLPYDVLRMVLLASFQRGPLPSDFKIDGLLQPTADQYRGLVLVRGVCKLWNDVAEDLLHGSITPSDLINHPGLANSRRLVNARLVDIQSATARTRVRSLAVAAPSSSAPVNILGALHLFPNLLHLEIHEMAAIWSEVPHKPALPKVKLRSLFLVDRDRCARTHERLSMRTLFDNIVDISELKVFHLC